MDKITTSFICPPIPMRDFDWCAMFGNYAPGSPIGFGMTRQDAVEDLLSQVEDHYRDAKVMS